MKVVLLRNVKGVGRAHDTVEAKDGYALNFLIPQKYAISATESAVKAASMHRAKADKEREITAALFAQNISALSEALIVIKAKASEKEHLYDAIGAQELSAAVKEQAHIDLPEEAVRLEKPIKSLGTFTIPIALGESFGSFSVAVEAA